MTRWAGSFALLAFGCAANDQTQVTPAAKVATDPDARAPKMADAAVAISDVPATDTPSVALDAARDVHDLRTTETASEASADIEVTVDAVAPPACPDGACDDGDPCTIDACLDGACASSLSPDGTTCDDQSLCTAGDVCSAGLCKGTPLECGPNTACASWECTPSVGCVLHSAGDGVPCEAPPCVDWAVCAGGVCASGPPTDCDDGNACTSDACEAAAGCVSLATEANACDDGNACTSDDSCADGACIGLSVTCETGAPCEIAHCDPATGCTTTSAPYGAPCDPNACVEETWCLDGYCMEWPPIVCDDSNPCTADGCDASVGCFATVAAEGTPCDDGDACTSDDSCAGEACIGLSVTCEAGAPCQLAHCDPASGCTTTLAPYGAPCDPNACVEETWCADGYCMEWPPIVCDDGNPCTTDGCAASVGCFAIVAVDGTPCDDGDACTTADKCTGASCNSVQVDCGDDEPCRIMACDPGLGCFPVNAPDGAPCPGGECFTTAECASGECILGAPVACDDGNVCTTDACQALVGCVSTAAASGVSCDDGDTCTAADACLEGQCVGGPVVACQGTACAPEHCDASAGCVVTPMPSGEPCSADPCRPWSACVDGTCAPGPMLDCDDANACSLDACEAMTGCTHVAVTDSLACDDGDACTAGDACQAGACAPGTPISCDDGNTCTSNACDPAFGCEAPTPLDGAPCDDGDACTTLDACVGSECLAVPLVCTSGECAPAVCVPKVGCVAKPKKNGAPCTLDACTWNSKCLNGVCQGGEPVMCDQISACAVASCVAEVGCVAKPLPDGTGCWLISPCSPYRCVNGVCIETPKWLGACDDGLPCTSNDTCNYWRQCVGQPASGLACDDGVACTSEDVCTEGTCAGTPDPTCDDGNPCTFETCLGPGCVSTPLLDGMPCDGDDPCVYDMACAGGVCAGGTKCDDGDPCTADLCAPGSCKHVQLQLNDPCDDSNACSTGERCVARPGTSHDYKYVCMGGTGVPCSDGDPCTIDLCRPDLGCSFAPVADGEPCSDLDECTGPDVCLAGECKGGPLPCTGGKPCADAPSPCLAWTVSTIASEGDVGRGAASAVDTEGHVHVVYRNVTAGRLEHAVGAGSTWVVSSLPSILQPKDDRLALGVGPNGEIALAYYLQGYWETLFVEPDAAAAGPLGFTWMGNAIDVDPILLFAENGARHVAAAGVHSTYVQVDVARTLPIRSWTLYTAVPIRCFGFALDRKGYEVVAYRATCDPSLRIARESAAGWTETVVEVVPASLSGLPSGAAVAVDAGGRLHVAYASSTGAGMRYATDASGVWDREDVEVTGSLANGAIVMDVDPAGRVLVAWADVGQLRAATRSTGGGWTTDVVQPGEVADVSIAHAPAGPILVYQLVGPRDLRMASRSCGTLPPCEKACADCDDGDPCTADTCIDGECKTTPVLGEDVDADGTCDAGDNCLFVANADQLDRDFDDAGDACDLLTSCTKAATCSDADPCTIDLCLDAQCVNAPLDCDDRDPCTVDMCVAGACATSAAKDGTLCSDANPCTDDDACKGGACHGVPLAKCGDVECPPVALGWAGQPTGADLEAGVAYLLSPAVQVVHGARHNHNPGNQACTSSCSGVNHTLGIAKSGLLPGQVESVAWIGPEACIDGTAWGGSGGLIGPRAFIDRGAGHAWMTSAHWTWTDTDSGYECKTWSVDRATAQVATVAWDGLWWTTCLRQAYIDDVVVAFEWPSGTSVLRWWPGKDMSPPMNMKKPIRPAKVPGFGGECRRLSTGATCDPATCAVNAELWWEAADLYHPDQAVVALDGAGLGAATLVLRPRLGAATNTPIPGTVEDIAAVPNGVRVRYSDPSGCHLMVVAFDGAISDSLCPPEGQCAGLGSWVRCP